MEGSTVRWTRDGRFFQRGGERLCLKGIAYGPFEKPLGESSACQHDLDHIAKLGFNALRVYERPTSAFLKTCEDRDLSVFVSLKWESNTDFRQARESILQSLAEDVVALRSEPAVAGYFTGNEIPATLVRWMGGDRVRRFLETAFQHLRELDPGRLFAYANYPSTEYLQPRNGDFAAFNIYLEEREAVRRYMRRLHHLADEQPLVITEYGLDSVRNGEELQAETLAWLTEEIFDSGAAGAFLFSYTDDWFNGGRQMEDWGFGIVHGDRTPKPSVASVSASLIGRTGSSGGNWKGAPPLVSVIVCTHNGHAYLPTCLESLARSCYPNYEILVIDDGSRPGIAVMASEVDGVRYVRQEHLGLSAARNRGAAEAKGEILAFTDDDCEPDRDWLVYLVEEILSQGVDCCGGPNIAPEVDGLMAQCVEAAPGNPTHVMLDDFRAEHLPGCNLAVTREAFDSVNGFGEHYRVAGDDVDFCWRLQFEKRRLGFAPNAVVVHHRRKTWRAFLKQQVGYGRAEALLQWDHPQKYTGIGGTSWRGTVYAPLATRSLSRPVIYFGQDGLAPFQAIYNTRRVSDPVMNGLATSFPWVGSVAVLSLLAFGVPWVWWVVALMLVISVGTALRCSWHLYVPQGASLWLGRAYLAWLHWSPVVGRNVARWLNAAPRRWYRALWEKRLAYWNTEGVGRESLLAEVRKELVLGGHRLGPTKPNQWSPFDLLLPSTAFAHLTLVTVTEHHEYHEELTRVAVRAYLKRSVLAVLVLLSSWMLGQALAGNWGWFGLGFGAGGVTTLAVYLHTRKQFQEWMTTLARLADRAGLEKVEG